MKAENRTSERVGSPVLQFASDVFRQYPGKLSLIVALLTVVSLTQGLAIALLLPMLSVLNLTGQTAAPGMLVRAVTSLL